MMVYVVSKFKLLIPTCPFCCFSMTVYMCGWASRHPYLVLPQSDWYCRVSAIGSHVRWHRRFQKNPRGMFGCKEGRLLTLWQPDRENYWQNWPRLLLSFSSACRAFRIYFFAVMAKMCYFIVEECVQEQTRKTGSASAGNRQLVLLCSSSDSAVICVYFSCFPRFCLSFYLLSPRRLAREKDTVMFPFQNIR